MGVDKVETSAELSKVSIGNGFVLQLGRAGGYEPPSPNLYAAIPASDR